MVFTMCSSSYKPMNLRGSLTPAEAGFLFLVCGGSLCIYFNFKKRKVAFVHWPGAPRFVRVACLHSSERVRRWEESRRVPFTPVPGQFHSRGQAVWVVRFHNELLKFRSFCLSLSVDGETQQVRERGRGGALASERSYFCL